MLLELKLKIIGGKHAGRELTVGTPTYLIGRDEVCNLRPSSEVVSRRHCQLSVDANGVRIEDFKSSNGTFVNGDRVVGERMLTPGDQVKVGPLEFQVLFIAPAALPTADGPASQLAAPPDKAEADIMHWLTGAPGDKPLSTKPAESAAGPAARITDTGSAKLDGTQFDFWPESAAAAEQAVPKTKAVSPPKMNSAAGKQPDPNDANNSRDAAIVAIDNFRNRKK
jgi:predicted component of type VI protein secretion system